MRVFAGIPVPGDIRARIDDYVRELSNFVGGVRWVNVENLHITLKFLGEVDEEIVPVIIENLKSASARMAPFPLSFTSLGAFPSLRYPRVYWIGVGRGSDMVRTLHEHIEKGLEKIGFPREGKAFYPHLTIGRMKKRGKGAEFQVEASCFGEFCVKDFLLYKSTITPKGPIYDIIGKMSFGVD